MADYEQFATGPTEASVRKDPGESWTLVLVRNLRHAPEKVWQALTQPEHLKEWAPFEADGSLATAGAAVKLTTVGAPQLHVTETTITRADAPRLLEFNWGGGDVKWELEAKDGGTRLTLWASIGKQYVAMGAAGWTLCIEVLDRHLAGTPVGRIAGPEAMKFAAWRRLNDEYGQQFGVEKPQW